MTDCAICLHLLRTPVKVLVCGHSFCLPCLRRMRQEIGTWNVDGRITLSCPTCRQETLLPNGRVSGLSTNYALNEVLDRERRNNGVGNEQEGQIHEEDINSSLFYSTDPIQNNEEGDSLDTTLSAIYNELVNMGQIIANIRTIYGFEPSPTHTPSSSSSPISVSAPTSISLATQSINENLTSEFVRDPATSISSDFGHSDRLSDGDYDTPEYMSHISQNEFENSVVSQPTRREYYTVQSSNSSFNESFDATSSLNSSIVVYQSSASSKKSSY